MYYIPGIKQALRTWNECVIYPLSVSSIYFYFTFVYLKRKNPNYLLRMSVSSLTPCTVLLNYGAEQVLVKASSPTYAWLQVLPRCKMRSSLVWDVT